MVYHFQNFLIILLSPLNPSFFGIFQFQSQSLFCYLLVLVFQKLNLGRKIISIFPAIAIYIFYLSLLILTRDLIDGDNSLSQYYIWLTHLLFLLIGLFGLFWQDFLKPNIIFKKRLFSRIMLIIFIIFLFVWIVS